MNVIERLDLIASNIDDDEVAIEMMECIDIVSELYNSLLFLCDWPHPSPKANGVLCKQSEYAVGLANVRRFAREAMGKDYELE